MRDCWLVLVLVALLGGTAIAVEEPAPTSTDILLTSLVEDGAAVSGGPAIPPAKPEERDENRAPQYRVWGYFSRRVSDQSHSLSMVRQEFYTPIPIHISETDILAATVMVRNMHFETAANLPDVHKRFPGDLWDIRLGLTYIHTFENGWKFGILPRLGSPSDKPFAGLREMTLGSTAFVRFPAAREGDNWTFSLSYFPNSQVSYPAPGMTYEWNPSDQLKVGLGLPFSLMWKPTEQVRLDVNYTPFTQVTARASWNPRKTLRFYTGFDWDNEGYFLTGRRDRTDLFFFYEKRLVVGTRIDLGERFAFDLSSGYAFDREFGSGRTPLNFTSNRLTIQSGPFISSWLLMFF